MGGELVRAIMTNADTPSESACWPWQRSKFPNGYGQVYIPGRKNRYAHRASYEAFKGPIPEGFTVDHQCHNRDSSCAGGNSCAHRSCVNPTHLEAVPIRVNLHRGRTLVAANLAKTHCVRGHKFESPNTLNERPYGHRRYSRRRCRACRSVEKSVRQTILTAASQDLAHAMATELARRGVNAERLQRRLLYASRLDRC